MDSKQRTADNSGIGNHWNVTRIFFSYRTLKLIQIHKTLINQNFLLLEIIKKLMLTRRHLITEIIEKQWQSRDNRETISITQFCISALMMSLETKLILDLAIWSKSTTRDVSNILIRKVKHQKKAQEVNSYLKEQCKEFHIHYINHEKSLKPQHLNKLRLHLNNRY